MVETAISVPWFVLMVLGIVQLGMMQHARIMTEYAAYNAARAGVVWNGDSSKMKSAAMVSLVPTVAESDSLETFIEAYLMLYLENGIGQAVLGSPLIKIDTLGPTQAAFTSQSAPGPDEIDFDDPANADNTLLTVRVRYLYQMRIPFANSFFFEAWLAGLGGSQVASGLFPYRKYKGISDLDKTTRLALEAAEAKWDDDTCKRAGVTSSLITSRLMPMAAFGRYYLPMTATWSMRMQSNPFKKFAPPANQNLCSD
jgi:hypothetical protein